MSRTGRAAHAACLHLAANLRLAESQAGAARERQELRLEQLEEQLAARARDAELEKAALTARSRELGVTRVGEGRHGGAGDVAQNGKGIWVRGMGCRSSRRGTGTPGGMQERQERCRSTRTDAGAAGGVQEHQEG